MKDEIKEFIEFRTDEDGTYFYYNDKDNIEQWSYKLDELKDYITNLQDENERLRKNQKLTPEQRNHLHLELDEVLEIYKSRIITSIILLNKLQEKIINNNYIVTDLDLDNIMKELGDN